MKTERSWLVGQSVWLAVALIALASAASVARTEGARAAREREALVGRSSPVVGLVAAPRARRIRVVRRARAS